MSIEGQLKQALEVHSQGGRVEMVYSRRIHVIIKLKKSPMQCADGQECPVLSYELPRWSMRTTTTNGRQRQFRLGEFIVRKLAKFLAVAQVKAMGVLWPRLG